MTLESKTAKSSTSMKRVSSSSTKTPSVASDKSCSKPVKKKPARLKSLPILVAIKPMNLEEERERFFDSGFKYDPQFRYVEDTERAQRCYGKPSDKYVPQAVKVIELTLERYGTYAKYELKSGGAVLSQEEIITRVTDYLQANGMTSEIRVNITPHLISYASMTRVKGVPTINIKSGCTRRNWIEGMLNHELGTHYIRSYNQKLQSWKSRKQRKKLRLLPANPTEEGLASLNTHIYRDKPVLIRSALTYLTVYLASQLSFSQTFEKLSKYIENPETRWGYVLRAKRGQTDTSQPGCFPKDQIYFTGALEILANRRHIDFDCLYQCGKVSYKDLGKLGDQMVTEGTRLPYFLSNKEEYMKRLDKIVEFNRLTHSDFT